MKRKTKIHRINFRLFLAIALCVFAQLTVWPTSQASPPTSASGKIVFVSNRDGNNEIYVMNADGSNQSRLTNDPADDGGPAWSPDGSKIAFTSNRAGGNYDVWLMNADGTNPVRLTNDPAYDGGPDWSPDGTQLVFTSGRTNKSDIYIMNADGTGQMPIPNANWILDDGDPVFSPDGRKVAWGTNQPGFRFDIFTINLDGTAKTNFSNGGGSGGNGTVPAWSPDGTRIAFSNFYFDGGGYEIVSMGLFGGPAFRLTNDPAFDFWVTWSPDSTMLAFMSDRTGNNEIYVMNADGTNRVNISNNPASDQDPDWTAGPIANPSPTPTPLCTPPPSNMISWWPGDGNAQDIQDGNHGTLMGGAGFGTGKVSQAFLFDGIDDYVDAGNSPNLHVSAGDFTVDAWVKFNALSHPPGANIGAPPGDMSIVDKMSQFSVNGDGWRLIKQHDNRFWFCFGAGGNGCGGQFSPTTVVSTTVVTTGVWYHVAAVKSSAGIAIYVNGVQEHAKGLLFFIDTHSADLLIGASQLESARLNGLIDEVEIFNRALSGTEIAAIHGAGSAGKCKVTDQCPDDPNKTEPGVCGCGVPDTDGDGDGTPDCNDECPSDPNKTAPGVCGCSVPDTDGDGDGTPDCIDQCPNDPGKTQPGICGCGAPDTDADADGVADCVDNCPAVFNPDQRDTNGDGVGDACTPFEFPAGGAFVIGNLVSLTGGSTVYFWGSQWQLNNPMSTGPGPNVFKGFESSNPLPPCGDNWTSQPGNSSNPPGTVPRFMAVIVSSSVQQSGSVITGNIRKIVVIETNPGYGPAPGHVGTGKVVAILCGQ